MRLSRGLLLPALLAALLSGCGEAAETLPPDSVIELDAGASDAGTSDAGRLDGGDVIDAGASDAGTNDAGRLDGGDVIDAGASDAGTNDAGRLDGGNVIDAGASDAGTTDAGRLDGGNVIDAGASDGGVVVDAGAPDAGAPDAGPGLWLAAALTDSEVDDTDSAPLSGTPFIESAFVSAQPCSRRTYGRVADCYNEVDPEPPVLQRSLVQASRAPAADALPAGFHTTDDGSVNHVGKVQALPALRSSNDGRVMVAGGCDGCDALQFRVFRPENVGFDQKVTDSTKLIHDLRNDLYNWIGAPQHRLLLWDPVHSALTPESTDGNGGLHLPDVLQSTVCEASSDRTSSGLQGNVPVAETLPSAPRACLARYGASDTLEAGDCYDLSVLVGASAQGGPRSRWELRSVDLTLFVRSPKRRTTGQTGFAEGSSNFLFAYPRDPTGATTANGVQTLPPFENFEFARAFQLLNGRKQISCPDARGNDLTGAQWWECFGGSKYPDATKFQEQLQNASGTGACWDARGNEKSSHPGFCEYFFRQHQASNLTLDDDEDSTFGDGRAWNGRTSNCPRGDTACIPGLAMFESITSGDGRLLVLNAKGLYYAYSSVGPCRADGFSQLEPISWMPGDTRINQKYELARVTGGRPFRDPFGREIPFGTTNFGAYGWMDRHVRNLFYAAQNLARDGWFARSTTRFDYAGTPTGTLNLSRTQPGSNTERASLDPDRGPGSQYALIGSWTQGKAVMVDELNVSDFGGGEQGGTFPANTDPRQSSFSMRLWSGAPDVTFRSKGVQSVSSFEHVLGHHAAMRPTLPFDVVWGMQTDIQRNVEIAFDPYLQPRAIVVAHMNAPMRMDQAPRGSNDRPRQVAFVEDGFVAQGDVGASIRYGETADFRFAQSPKLQNAATADARLFPSAAGNPSFLTVRGGARIEPVGMGGVLGKGLWLDGFNDHVAASIGAVAVPSQRFYAGLWFEPHDTDLGVRPRTLLFFQGGGFIGLRSPRAGERELVIAPGNGTPLRALPLGSLVAPRRWSHLGVAVHGDAARRFARIWLDGTVLADVALGTSTGSTVALTLSTSVRPGSDNFFLGDPGPQFVSSPAVKRRTFRGWLDELRLLSLADGEAESEPFAELACNEALGTLVDVSVRPRETASRHLTALRTKQAAYPGRPTRICERLQLQPGADESLQVAMLPAQHEQGLCIDRVHGNPRPERDLADRCLRASLLQLPQLTWDQPRPDSRTNGFCLTCHADASPTEGLKLQGPLRSIPGLPRWLDPRRQPMHVSSRLGGALPQVLQSGGQSSSDPLDRWFDGRPYLLPGEE